MTLLEIPSKNEVRVKNLFNVADCKMHWQKTGDYLCVKVKNIILFFKYRSTNIDIAIIRLDMQLYHIEVHRDRIMHSLDKNTRKHLVVHSDPDLCIFTYMHMKHTRTYMYSHIRVHVYTYTLFGYVRIYLNIDMNVCI